MPFLRDPAVTDSPAGLSPAGLAHGARRSYGDQHSSDLIPSASPMVTESYRKRRSGSDRRFNNVTPRMKPSAYQRVPNTTTPNSAMAPSPISSQCVAMPLLMSPSELFGSALKSLCKDADVSLRSTHGRPITRRRLGFEGVSASDNELTPVSERHAATMLAKQPRALANLMEFSPSSSLITFNLRYGSPLVFFILLIIVLDTVYD